MIYVVGSINVDLSAALARFPRAGETVAAESFTVGLGGKGANQAVAVSKLGGECAMIGKVGSDAFGGRLKAGLDAYGVDTRFVTAAEGDSGLAVIWVRGGNNRIVTSGGANFLLNESDVDEGLAAAKAGDVLIVQLEVPQSVAARALKIGRRKGMITVLNPAPASPLGRDIYENAEIIAPNETETEILTGVRPDCEVNVALAVKKLREKGAENVVITLGKIGSAVAAGREITLIPAYKVKAVDTTAAGDTYIGALALGLYRKQNIAEAAKFATKASALKVTRRGAADAIPTAEEAEAAFGG